MATFTVFDDTYFMKQALNEADKALEMGEIPVGAVVVSNQRIIARAHNTVEQLNDVTAHAEILAITAASQAIGYKYLNNCTLYVTLEPCVMCAGALYWSQIGRLVYGAEDEKRGFMRIGKSLLHPSTQVAFGLLEYECRSRMENFFATLRNN
jgi:tRNA(adenine34) deaminase